MSLSPSVEGSESLENDIRMTTDKRRKWVHIRERKCFSSEDGRGRADVEELAGRDCGFENDRSYTTHAHTLGIPIYFSAVLSSICSIQHVRLACPSALCFITLQFLQGRKTKLRSGCPRAKGLLGWNKTATRAARCMRAESLLTISMCGVLTLLLLLCFA